MTEPTGERESKLALPNARPNVKIKINSRIKILQSEYAKTDAQTT